MDWFLYDSGLRHEGFKSGWGEGGGGCGGGGGGGAGGANPWLLTFGEGNSVTGTKQASILLLMVGQNNRMSEKL